MTRHSDRGDDEESSEFPQTSRRDFMRSTAAASAGAAATGLGVGSMGTAGASEHPTNTPWLEVEGNKVYDPLGNEVILRGVNIPDPKRLDHTVSARGKNWDHMIDLATNHERGWYANVIRIPVHPGDIAELPPIPEAEVDVHMPPTFEREELIEYCETYLDDVVQHCFEQDTYCIVDYHRHWGESTLDWRNDDLDEEVRMFWDVVAQRYADDPHVLFEVYNEPNQPAMYGGWPEGQAGTWAEWKNTAQPWVDQIREHAPDNLIIVGSPGWSAMPEGVIFEEFDGGNLMYAYHIYGGHGLRTEEEFDGRESAEGTAGVWEQVPLFTTEFGWEPNVGDGYIGGTTDDFGVAIKEWMDNRPIHWTAWCFDITWLPSMWERAFVEDDPEDSVGDPYSGDIPELCDEPPCEWELTGQDVGDYDDYAGAFIKDWLDERKADDVPQVAYDPEPPAAPPNLEASSVTESSVEVSWDEPANPGDSPFSHYTVWVDGTKMTELEETSAEVTDLLSGSTLEVGVTAHDMSDNVSEPATIEIETDPIDDDAAPSAPPNVTLSDRTYHSLTVAWDEATPNGSDLFEYVVYFEGEEAVRLEDEVTSYTFEDLDPDAQYDVAVTAYDRAKNESPPSEVVVETRPVHATDDDLLVNDYDGSASWPDENDLGNTVSGGLGQGVEDGALQLDWGGASYYVTGISQDVSDYVEVRMRIRGAEGGEAGKLEFDMGGYSDSLNGLSDDAIGTEFDVFTIDLEAHDFDLTEPGNIQIDSTYGTDGTVYIDEIWFAAEDDPTDGVVERGNGDRPDAPSNLTATDVSESSVTLEWDGVADADHYVVTGDREETVSGTSTTIGDLEAGTAYQFGVATVDADGEQSLPTSVSVTTPDGGSACDGAAASETLDDGSTVCDVDGDGQYMDVSGDGSVTNADVTEFFRNQHASPMDDRADLFDFTGDDEVTQADVVELFQRIVE